MGIRHQFIVISHWGMNIACRPYCFGDVGPTVSPPDPISPTAEGFAHSSLLNALEHSAGEVHPSSEFDVQQLASDIKQFSEMSQKPCVVLHAVLVTPARFSSCYSLHLPGQWQEEPRIYRSEGFGV